MDVSYSAWRQVSEESRVISKESFSFLFDRRYTNRLNRMSRVFFEAYIKATREVAAEEDRFPSLSEIESRMESGAIYAYKDRLMRSTEFFDEVKVSGISYLIPRARRFVDETGTYTDMILDFDEGAVVLPKREPVVAPPKPETASETASEKEAEKDEAFDLDQGETTSKEAKSPEAEDKGASEVEPAAKSEFETTQKSDTIPDSKPGLEPEIEAEPEVVSPEGLLSEPEPELEAEVSGEVRAQETSKEKLDKAPGISPEKVTEEKVPTQLSEGRKSPEIAKVEKVEPAPKEAMRSSMDREGTRDLSPKEIARQIHAESKTSKKPSARGAATTPKIEQGKMAEKIDRRILLAVALIVIVGIFAAYYLFPPKTLEKVEYSAYLSNVSGSTYLNVDITNPSGLENQLEIVIPPDIEKSINVVGGTVSISYTNRTAIQLASRNDANISICLIEKFEAVPVTFNVKVPPDFNSDLLVHNEYQASSRKGGTIQLKCNCTSEPLRFDQVYLKPDKEHEKNVSRDTSSGPDGAQERSQKNVTESL